MYVVTSSINVLLFTLAEKFNLKTPFAITCNVFLATVLFLGFWSELFSFEIV